MNARLVNSAAGVILAALTQNRTAAGIALSLESAQLLLTPEMTAELVRLQLRVDEVERAYTFDTAELKRRVAELEAERHTTNEALDTAVQELRRRDTPAAPYAATPETHASMRAALARHYSNARHGACENCGAAPENWCPDCAACEQGCFGGFDGNNCPHSNAKWGGGR